MLPLNITRSSGKKISPTFLSYDTDAQKMRPPKVLLCRGNILTPLLPNNDRGAHRLADTGFRNFFY